MLLKIPHVMPPAQVAELRGLLERTQFQDGTQTGHPGLKNNLQVLGRTPEGQQGVNVILRALLGNRQFTSFAQPLNFQVMFNRYDVGMFYKDHMDAALMGGLKQGVPMRTDLSFTVFLTDPAEYEGGDFVIRTGFGDLRVRGELGHAICYPSNMLHRVEPVTRGARWAAVGWVESLFRDQDQRQIIYELEQLRTRVTGNRIDHPEDEAFAHIRENLVRQWAEA